MSPLLDGRKPQEVKPSRLRLRSDDGVLDLNGVESRKEGGSKVFQEGLVVEMASDA